MVRRNCAHHAHGIAPGASSNLALVYMQLSKRVDEFCFSNNLSNSERNLLDDDGKVFLSTEELYELCVCGVCIINTFLSNELLDYLV